MKQHPGRYLYNEFFEPSGKTQSQFAKKLGWSIGKLHKILTGFRDINPETAIELSRAFKTTPEFWLYMQADWDLHVTMERIKLKKRL